MSSNPDLLESGSISHLIGSNQELTLRDQDSQAKTFNETPEFNHSYLDKLKTLKQAKALTYQTSKKKIWHSNGLEFYRVRSGFNEVAKLRFQHETESKTNNFKTIQ